MMKRGATFGAEHIEFTDRETGAAVVQLTNAPVHSHAFYFEYPSFNTTNDTVFFYSQRVGMRGAPWDLYCVDGDGKRITLLSDAEHPLSAVYPAPDDSRAVYGVRGNAVIRLNIDTLEEREVARCEGVRTLSGGSMDGAGRWFATLGTKTRDDKKINTTLRIDTRSGEVAELGEDLANAHLTINHAGTILHFRHAWSGPDALAVCDIDGNNFRSIGFQDFAHRMWLGTTDRLQGPLLPPGHGIVQVELDDTEPTPICSGPYFWHSASSADGEWIVADTNWPEQGIMLVHVASGRYAPVTMPHACPGAAQYTHPHPSFDRTGSRVIYTVNRGGLSQVYVATIPDALRRELVTGEITNRLRLR